MELVSLTLWEHNLENVKATCLYASSSLSCELQCRFLDCKLMTAMGIVYLHY
jgi:hypothetical protein